MEVGNHSVFVTLPLPGSFISLFLYLFCIGARCIRAKLSSALLPRFLSSLSFHSLPPSPLPALLEAEAATLGCTQRQKPFTHTEEASTGAGALAAGIQLLEVTEVPCASPSCHTHTHTHTR